MVIGYDLRNSEWRSRQVQARRFRPSRVHAVVYSLLLDVGIFTSSLVTKISLKYRGGLGVYLSSRCQHQGMRFTSSLRHRMKPSITANSILCGETLFSSAVMVAAALLSATKLFSHDLDHWQQIASYLLSFIRMREHAFNSRNAKLSELLLCGIRDSHSEHTEFPIVFGYFVHTL